MASKGVDYYAFLDDDGLGSPLSAAFSGPGKVGGTVTAAQNLQKHNLQIESGNLPWNEWTGPFTWNVTSGGGSLAAKTNMISSLTGNLESGSQMTTMLSMPPIRAAGALIDYGFYDAGPGTSGLTNQDQSWVYCTPDLSQWMGELAAQHSQVDDSPLSTFVLAGAHDTGMMTLETVEAVRRSDGMTGLLAGLTVALPEVALALSLAPVSQVIQNAAMTQKDTVSDMLALGCRYFDFRPGTMYPAITGFEGRYHQHLVIPGIPYIDFLVDLLKALQSLPGEIAVVSCNTQGFESSVMAPTPADLASDWQAAVTRANVTSIIPGDASSLDKTYGELIATDTRIIFLNQIDGETTKYDSYNSSYATLTPAPIVLALNSMTTAGQQGATYTVLQLQGTCSGIISKDGFLSEGLTASPLMSTKAQFDAATLPWVSSKAPGNLTAPKLVVLLNDFIDNATAETAIQWTRERMGLL